MKACCLCDDPGHVCRPDIDAGLPTLNRQVAGFPEYRQAMLRNIPRFRPLSDWRAREGADLGIMLVEMWAYVLDVVGFYDERIANETYLRTAVLSPSLRKLVELIGYQPRPALAASVILAAIADGHQPVTLPPRTGFRSDAFGKEAPQIFEIEKEFIIHPLTNEWRVAPVRPTSAGAELLLDLDTAALSRDQLVVIRAADKLHAGRVETIETITARDGVSYKQLVMKPAPRLDASLRLDQIEILSPSKAAAVDSFGAGLTVGAVGAIGATSVLLASRASSRASSRVGFATAGAFQRRSSLILDTVYSALSETETVVIQRGADLHAATVTAVETGSITVRTGTTTTPEVKMPATQIALDPPIPWTADPKRLVVHFGMAKAGRITQPAKTELEVKDFALPGLPLEGPLEPIPDGTAKPGELLLLDARDNGAFANGSVDIDRRGRGTVFVAAATPPFSPALRTPVSVFGNLVQATRGESVLNETLGSGDSAVPFLTFALAKHPLTYINDSAARDGRRTTLEVRVNGIRWTEVSSFFGARPESEVYTVRQDDEGKSIVRFGDGITGARLLTGIDNVTATYRFGAGAAKPPAGAIGQVAKPVAGLRRVVNPVAAGGGRDADQPKDIKKNAPNSALLLGRAVSIPDFEALAREFGGVINAHAEWAWDETRQSAMVKVTFISDGGDIARNLRAFLIGSADPTTPLVAVEAKAQPSRLVIDLEVDSRFNSRNVSDQVAQTLTNPENGLLAKQNIPIGLPLFRSRIFDAVLNVEGTRSVRVMTVDGAPAPFAIIVGQDRYRDFLNGLFVEGSS